MNVCDFLFTITLFAELDLLVGRTCTGIPLLCGTSILKSSSQSLCMAFIGRDSNLTTKFAPNPKVMYRFSQFLTRKCFHFVEQNIHFSTLKWIRF